MPSDSGKFGVECRRFGRNGTGNSGEHVQTWKGNELSAVLSQSLISLQFTDRLRTEWFPKRVHTMPESGEDCVACFVLGYPAHWTGRLSCLGSVEPLAVARIKMTAEKLIDEFQQLD